MSNMSQKPALETIGSTEFIEVAGIKNVPAKIDTGADSSAIWASDIKMEPDNSLSFTLFSQKSPLYTGKRITSNDYTVKYVRSSHGDQQVRYQVKLKTVLHGHTIKVAFTLANRSRNNFPALIGRRTLRNKFLIDVSKSSIKRQKNPGTPRLKRELKENPHEFHQKYIERSK